MNSLGWSRREQPANTNKQTPLLGSLSKLNPFSSEGNVRLPTTEGEGPGAPLPARTRREEEEGWFARKSATSSIHQHHLYAHAGTAHRAQRTRFLPRLSSFGGGRCTLLPLGHIRIMHTKDVGVA